MIIINKNHSINSKTMKELRLNQFKTLLETYVQIFQLIKLWVMDQLILHKLKIEIKEFRIKWIQWRASDLTMVWWKQIINDIIWYHTSRILMLLTRRKMLFNLWVIRALYYKLKEMIQSTESFWIRKSLISKKMENQRL